MTPSSGVINQQKKHNMPPYSSCGVIQVSASTGIQIRLEKTPFTPCCNPKCQLPGNSGASGCSHRNACPWVFRGAWGHVKQWTFRLKTRCEWRCFEWTMNESGLADTWMTPHEQYVGMLCFFCWFIKSRCESPVTSIGFDSATTLFTLRLK